MNTTSLEANSFSRIEIASAAKSARHRRFMDGCVHRAVRLLAVSVLVLWVAAYDQAGRAATVQNYELHNFKLDSHFVLTNQFGNRTSLEDFKGQVVLIFFGFTNCPDICPTTMAEMARVIQSLGARAESARVVFITVDPDRDTPERLKDYIAYFDETIVGLTGSGDEITEVTKRYDTRFRKQAPDDAGHYSVDHTSLMYILDQTGRARYALPSDVGLEMIMEGITSLLDNEG